MPEAIGKLADVPHVDWKNSRLGMHQAKELSCGHVASRGSPKRSGNAQMSLLQTPYTDLKGTGGLGQGFLDLLKIAEAFPSLKAGESTVLRLQASNDHVDKLLRRTPQ